MTPLQTKAAVVGVQPFLRVVGAQLLPLGKAVKARMSGAASGSNSATWGKGSRSCSTTRSDWAITFVGDSCR